MKKKRIRGALKNIYLTKKISIKSHKETFSNMITSQICFYCMYTATHKIVLLFFFIVLCTEYMYVDVHESALLVGNFLFPKKKLNFCFLICMPFASSRLSIRILYFSPFVYTVCGRWYQKKTIKSRPNKLFKSTKNTQ